MKKIVILICTVGLMVSMTACLSSDPVTKELNNNDTNKAVAKVDATQNTEKKEDTTKGEASEDIWTYYNDASWSDDFNGLKSEIIKVVVTDKAPNKEDESKKDASAVGIKVRLENTTEGIFTTYPDQATLVTSTGEQIDMPDMWVSDSIGGEIEKGVIKEGNVIWYLDRGHAEDITWVKIKWRAYQGESVSGESKEYAVELKLK